MIKQNIAKAISYIFHPLFIPTYLFMWLTWRFAAGFSTIPHNTLVLRGITTFWMTAFFPAFAVFLLWRLKFIDSIYLRSQKERIAPLIISMFFYWWMWYLSRHFTDQPIVLKSFYLGLVFTTTAALILNNFVKISAHSLGVAGSVALVVISVVLYKSVPAWDIITAVVIAGIVCLSRLILKEHTKGEVWLGLFVGVLCQVVSVWIVV